MLKQYSLYIFIIKKVDSLFIWLAIANNINRGDCMENISVIVGARVRAYRKNKGITQEELAERADLHHTYIGQVERGEKNLTLGSLDKILEALEVSFADFFEAIGFERDRNRVSLLCYELINSKNEHTQKKIYDILIRIEQMIKEN